MFVCACVHVHVHDIVRVHAFKYRKSLYKDQEMCKLHAQPQFSLSLAGVHFALSYLRRDRFDVTGLYCILLL